MKIRTLHKTTLINLWIMSINMNHDDIETGWFHNETEVNQIVDLFIKNLFPNYISHAEIREGRAINEYEWSPNIKEILLKEFESSLRNKVLDGSNIVFAKFKDDFVGFALLEYGESPNGKHAILSDIIVSEPFRRNGIGEKLVHWIEDALICNGIFNLYAESNVLNKSAHAFLHKQGFKGISKVFLKHL